MPDEPMREQHYAWLVVGLLWLVALLNYLDRQVIFSVFPLLEHDPDLHLSNLQLGLLGTVFLWVYGLLSPLTGFLGDRYGRKRVIILSLFAWSLVTWTTGLAPNFTSLLWARALMGVSEACYIPAALALIADYHGTRSRSLATGLHQSGIYVGIVLGGVGGGWLGEHFGWRFAFTILGIVGVSYTPVLTYLLKDQGPDISRGNGVTGSRLSSTLREVVSLPGFLTMTAVFMAASIGGWIAFTWMPVYLYERFNMSLTASGFSATFYMQLGSLSGILGGGWFADRWAQRSSQGRLLTQAFGLMLAAPFLFLVGFTSSPMLLVTALYLFGFGRGIYDCNVMPALCQIAHTGVRSTGYGIFNFAGCLAGGATAAVAGMVKSVIGIGGALQLAAAVLFVSAFLLLRLRPPAEVRVQL
jgi:MFS family permease